MITGAVVSIINGAKVRILLTLFAASLTVIVQFEYAPSARVLRVRVLVPTLAEEVVLVHEPPYVIVPASFVVNVYSGVIVFVRAGIAVT